MILIYTTFSIKKSAEKAVKIILKNRLAACVNYWPIESQYWWKNKVQKAKEWAVFIKTIKRNYQKIKKIIKENNPYEIPAIFSWSVERVEKII